MLKLTFFCGLLTILVNAKMIIKSDDISDVSSTDIENEATLIDTFERGTDCEGVKVVCCSIIHSHNEFLYFLTGPSKGV